MSIFLYLCTLLTACRKPTRFSTENMHLSRYISALYSILFVVAASCVAIHSAYALPTETYASSSRLASGKWVKIRVSEDGMQFVSNESLKKMGFATPSQVHIYGYGGRRLTQNLDSTYVDDLPLQPCVRTSDGILFFGVGTVNLKQQSSRIVHEQNPYSTASYYFVSDAPLREGESGEAAEIKTVYGSDDVRVNSAKQYLLHETELLAAGNTGSDLFGEDFRITSTRTFDFELPGAVGDKVTYNIAFASKAGSGSVVKVSADGTELGEIKFSPESDGDVHVRVQSKRFETNLEEGGKSSVTLKYSGSGVIYKAMLDYIECSYERALKLDASPLIFHDVVATNEHKVYTVSGIGANTLIWDVTNPTEVKSVAFDRDGDTAYFAPAGAGLRRYAVFNPEKTTLEPSAAGAVSNQDLHALETPDMVIITPKEFKAQAERIAEMHRTNDSMTVHVLTPEVIYNEFSGGSADVTAYRKLLKMWYDREWSSTGQTGQCLLFGRTTYDQRELTENLKSAKYPRILTWQTTVDLTTGSATISETNSYGSDNYIAFLDDTKSFSINNSKMRVGVGRMPVKSSTEARLMTDKLLSFVNEQDYGSWRNNVLLLADDGDYAIHAEQSNKLYDRLVVNGGGDLLYERMNIDAYDYGTNSYKKTYPQAKSKMLNLIEDGVSLWSYIGHANTTSLTGEDMWTYTDLSTMTNKHWPVLYTASCEFIRFDSDAISGCETMWLHPNSGIIAAIAANRKVFISNNETFTNAFGATYFKRGADNLPRMMGDVYMTTVNNAGTSDNRHRYALMGDPAMRVPVPTYNVKVESIADIQVEGIEDSSEYPVIPGLSKAKVVGSIINPDGTPNSEFNGTVVATLHDAEVVVTTKGHYTDSRGLDGTPISYNDRTNKLFTGYFPVKAGKWEATLLLPEEIENATTQARLTLHATGTTAGEEDSNRIDASGSTDKFFVYGWDTGMAEDNVPPEILYMYLNNSAFRNGGTVGFNPVFKAKVRDDSGINISTAGVGRLLTVMVDNNKVYDNLSDYFVTEQSDPGAGTITYPLTNLAEGEHTLEFLVWDNAGNSTRSGFNFRIAPQSEIPDLNIYTDASPAISSVTFYIDSAEAVSGLVEVFDLSGRRVWYNEAPKGDGALSTKWNLNDNGGTRVPRGIYLYRATVKDAAGNEHRATKKFAVGNP